MTNTTAVIFIKLFRVDKIIYLFVNFNYSII